MPLAISLLLAAVMVLLAVVSYVAVRRAAEEAAHQQVARSAQQVSELVGDALAPLKAEAERLAARPELRSLVRTYTDDHLAAASAIMTAAAPPTVVATELWSGGVRLLTTTAGAEDWRQRDPPPPGGREAEGGARVGALRAVGGTLLFPVSARIMENDATGATVVRWHRLVLSLRFTSGRYVIGNRRDTLWTDLEAVIAPPAMDLTRLGEASVYERPGTGRQLGAAAAIPGAPWLGVMELRYSAVLASPRDFLRRFALTSLLVFAVTLPFVWQWSRRLTRPLQQLTQAAEAIGGGDYTRRVPVTRQDELGRLAEVFNAMAAQIADTLRELEQKVSELSTTREQFVHAQRMEAVGRLAGGVAHDFNNLLTVIIVETDLALADAEADDPKRDALVAIRTTAERAASLTRQLLSFSRRQLLEPTVFDLADLVADVESMMKRLIGPEMQLVMRHGREPVQVRADRGQIEQVLLNLVVNARDASNGEGHVYVETQMVTLDEAYARTRDGALPGEYAVLVVSDKGAGMLPEVRSRLFEPFFTTKEAGKGTGLGLATCLIIVKQAGGFIDIYSEPGVGTTVKVYLPRVRAPHDAPADAETIARGGTESILVVEDDAVLLDISTRILRSWGYQVLSTSRAAEALTLLEDATLPAELLFTDVVLPDMSGRQLAERATALRPGIKVLFTSGYTDDLILQHRLVERDFALLQKPFTAEGLARKVRLLLD